MTNRDMLDRQIDRNNLLDFFKGIGCLLVVFIHIRFPGIVGNIIWKIGKFAVPLFFMTAGFYSYKKDEDIIIKRLVKILKIFIGAYIVYFVYSITFSIKDNTLSEFFKLNFSISGIVKLFLFSTVNFAIHLWYLIAMAETYLLLITIKRLDKENAFLKLVPLFIIIHIVVVMTVDSMSYPWFLKMSFLVWGLPFTLMGMKIAKIDEYPKTGNVILLIIIGMLILVFSTLINVSIDFTEVGVVLFSVGLFLMGAKYPKLVEKDNIIVFVGNKLSLNIYIWHVFIANAMRFFLKRMQFISFVASDWVFPIVVCIASVIFSYILYWGSCNNKVIITK